MNYEFSTLFTPSRWAIEPRALRGMLAQLKMATPEAVQAAVKADAERRSSTPRMVGDVAVITVSGPIVYKWSWFAAYFGCATIEEMQVQFRAALADPNVRSILFRFDSPGGEVSMVPEFAREIYAARGTKPIVSVCDVMTCSAAYWIASQTDVIYATDSSLIGSIGCYVEHEDISAMMEEMGIKITLIAHGDHKVDGNPYEPLSEAVYADIKADVDEVGGEFEADVARGRGVSKKVVLDTYGQGKVFRGKRALALGMADKTATFGAAIAKLSRGRAMADTSNLTVHLSVDPAPIAQAVAASQALIDAAVAETIASVKVEDAAPIETTVPNVGTNVPYPERAAIDAQQAAQIEQDHAALAALLGAS
jgi:signal peptide peptidase SppA